MSIYSNYHIQQTEESGETATSRSRSSAKNSSAPEYETFPVCRSHSVQGSNSRVFCLTYSLSGAQWNGVCSLYQSHWLKGRVHQPISMGDLSFPVVLEYITPSETVPEPLD